MGRRNKKSGSKTPSPVVSPSLVPESSPTVEPPPLSIESNLPPIVEEQKIQSELSPIVEEQKIQSELPPIVEEQKIQSDLSGSHIESTGLIRRILNWIRS
jgi:hypothetical protein